MKPRLLLLASLSQLTQAQNETDVTRTELISSLKGRSIPGFSLKIRSQIEALENSVSKSPRGHFVSKNSLHGTCADRPAGNQCCPGQDWNCQPPNAVCSCDAHCKKLGDCCPDYDDTCGYMLTDGPAQCRGDGTGRANGDPHYHTMDMKMIHFQGKCSYVLSKNCGDGPIDFKVVARNENRYGNIDMSWTKDVFIQYNGNRIEIRKGQILFWNGQRIYAPIQLPDGTLVDKSGMYITIKTFFGINVYYDGEGNAEVKATCDWFGKLCGLLGNYNGNPDDDYKGSDGVMYDDKSVEAWGETWRSWENDDDDDDQCALNDETILPESVSWFRWVDKLKSQPEAALPTCTDDQFKRAVKRCEILRDPKNVFAPCQAKVDPATFYENCVWDQCATKLDDQALCDSISAFSKACSDVSRPINWRSPSFCPVTCPANSHYDYCGPLCVDSCSDSQRGSKCKTANCIEGCFCDAGYLWDGLQCIRRESCGCVNGDISYRIGQTFYKKNCAKKCKCVGINHEECEDEGCRNNQECVKTDANIGRSVGAGGLGAIGIFGGAIEREPEYNCVKSTKPKVKEDPNGGTSFHLPLLPSDDYDYDILNIGGRSKNITKSKRPNRPDRTDNVPLANDPMRTIPMGPLVEFPECVPNIKWTRGQIKPDWIPPNKCCGNKPYNDMQFSCCNNLKLYDDKESKCCSKFGVVVAKDVKCSKKLLSVFPSVNLAVSGFL